MELTLALDTLSKAAQSKRLEADALDLAVSVLADKFAPELEALATANAEAAKAKAAEKAERVERQRIEADHEELKAELEVASFAAEPTE